MSVRFRLVHLETAVGVVIGNTQLDFFTWTVYSWPPPTFFSRLPSKPPVRFISRVSASRKTRLRDLDIMVAISLAASILLNSKNAGDVDKAWPRSSAALASPLALTMVDRLSWKACSTRYFALSAYCWAICFSSMAFVNSVPKCKSVMETSSRTM